MTFYCIDGAFSLCPGLISVTLAEIKLINIIILFIIIT